MKRSNEGDVVEAWKGLLYASARVVRGLDADMLERHGISLIWFDVLSRLKQAPHGRLRMHELEAASVFTRSGMTRLVDRIEDADLVRRARSPEDRRGVYVEITPAGREKVDVIWPDHVAGIERYFGRYVDPEEATVLRHAAAKILNGTAEVGIARKTS